MNIKFWLENLKETDHSFGRSRHVQKDAIKMERIAGYGLGLSGSG
jgi:hypothetical protein